jgi:hypothetical protein
MGKGGERTCHGFLYFVENEVHELIVAFECADDCIQVSLRAQLFNCPRRKSLRLRRHFRV